MSAPGSPTLSSTRSDSPPLQLDPSTLAALSSFYDEQAEAERQFQELEKKAHERLVAAQEGKDAGGELLSGLRGLRITGHAGLTALSLLPTLRRIDRQRFARRSLPVLDPRLTESGSSFAEPEKMMSVDEFRKLFGEDWQLSQFW